MYNQQNSSRIPYGQDMLIASDATAGATADDPSSVATINNSRTLIDNAFSQNGITAYVGPNADYANIGAAAGYPSVDVPIGYTSSGTTPMGMQILGRAWTEPALIGFAYSYEQATHRRVPATVADPALVCSTTTAGGGGGNASTRGNLPPTSATVAPSLGPIALGAGLVALVWLAVTGGHLKTRARP